MINTGCHQTVLQKPVNAEGKGLSTVLTVVMGYIDAVIVTLGHPRILFHLLDQLTLGLLCAHGIVE